jgi:hypothetical protein
MRYSTRVVRKMNSPVPFAKHETDGRQAQGGSIDILADYREWREQQPERIGTHSDRCHLWHEPCMIHRLAAEVARQRNRDFATARVTAANTYLYDEVVRLRMTADERRAVREAADAYEENNGDADCERIAAALRGLLERLG